MNNKGQGFSWVWAVVAVGIGLFFATIFWIVMDQVRYSASPQLLQLGGNAVNMSLLDSLFSIMPFLMLLGFGIFSYIVANATKGGDYVG